VESAILVTLDEVVHGSTRTLRLQRADQAEVQTLRVKIPPGVREGQMIRVAGKGGEGSGGGAPGHLYLRVSFAQHPDFRVKENTLYHELELSPWEAVLGATVPVPTLEGNVSMKIPPGTVPGREFRLRGKGLPSGHGTRGDLHAVVSIQVPTQLTTAEKILWESLAKGSTFDPRKET
jgi:curved DNA-binding protein